MNFLFEGLKEAVNILLSFDEGFLTIVWVSLKVSFLAILSATMIGVPLGVFLSFKCFPGQKIVINMLHTLMSAPTVVIGLTVYAMLSRQGPLGQWELLYTQPAMILGQMLLALPIIASLTITAVRNLDKRVQMTVASLGATPFQELKMLFHEASYGILAAIIAGYARVFSEIGISMMLGGNIKGYTRNITTAIALETGKGEFSVSLALGIILLIAAFLINFLFSSIQKQAK